MARAQLSFNPKQRHPLLHYENQPDRLAEQLRVASSDFKVRYPHLIRYPHLSGLTTRIIESPTGTEN